MRALVTGAAPTPPSCATALRFPEPAGMHGAYPATYRHRHLAGMALALASHVLLAWFLLSSSPPPPRGADASPAASRPEIQWLLPRPATPVHPLAAAAPPASTLRQIPVRRPMKRPSRPASAAAPPSSTPMPAAQADSAPPVEESAISVVPAQDEARRQPIDPARLVRELKLGSMAAGLDKRKRGETAPPLTLEAKLAAGFERAHQAGDTHWLKSAGMEEITNGTSSNGTRVYRMRSLLGTFCVYVTTDGRPPVSGTCPR